MYLGERQEIAEHGVNVTTYAMLLRDHARGELPEPLARSALIFADEAHRAMTEDRVDLLRRRFPSGAN